MKLSLRGSTVQNKLKSRGGKKRRWKKIKVCRESDGEHVRRNEGERKWDWQERRRGRNTRGLARQKERRRWSERCREMEKVGGRRSLKEESTLGIFSPGSVSAAQWSFSFFGKTFPFFLSISFFSLFPPSSNIIFSQTLHSELPAHSFLPSVCPNFLLSIFPPRVLSPFYLRPSFDGLHSLLSSPHLV